MGSELNKSLRLIRIKDGSLLDETSLHVVAEWAAEKDYLVLVERVADSTLGVGVVIEEGRVKRLPPRNRTRSGQKRDAGLDAGRKGHAATEAVRSAEDRLAQDGPGQGVPDAERFVRFKLAGASNTRRAFWKECNRRPHQEGRPSHEGQATRAISAWPVDQRRGGARRGTATIGLPCLRRGEIGDEGRTGVREGRTPRSTYSLFLQRQFRWSSRPFGPTTWRPTRSGSRRPRR